METGISMPKPKAQVTAPDVRDAIDAFVDAFNTNDLDRVMSFFSPEAVYRPGDGSELAYIRLCHWVDANCPSRNEAVHKRRWLNH
jgi:hypothetical protein